MQDLTMTQRDQARLQILNRVLAGRMTMVDAAALMGVSERHGWRLLARYRAEGAAALVHGNRGRAPVQRLAESVRQRVRELAATTYAGVNHSHLAELLAEREGIVLSRSSVRRIAQQVHRLARRKGDAAAADMQQAYRRLLAVATQTVRQARRVGLLLRTHGGPIAERLVRQFDVFLPRMEQAI